jgi:phage/plasmid-like protein (TIGR03299 family)
MLKLAGLDWKIALENLALADGTVVPMTRAVVRQSDRRVLSCVGPEWEPVQNADAFSVLQPFLDAGLATIETAGSLRDGARVWMLLRINSADSVIVPQSDDRVAKFLLVTMGHDGKLAFRVGFTPIRVVCNNTLQMALSKRGAQYVRLPHFSGINASIDALKKTITSVDAEFEKTADVFRALANVKIKSKKQVTDYLQSVYQPKKLTNAEKLAEVMDAATVRQQGAGLLADLLGNSPQSEIVEEKQGYLIDEVMGYFDTGVGNTMAGVKGTAWAAYNAVTEHLTHHRGRSDEGRLDSVISSTGGSANSRALSSAIDAFL